MTAQGLTNAYLEGLIAAAEHYTVAGSDPRYHGAAGRGGEPRRRRWLAQALGLIDEVKDARVRHAATLIQQQLTHDSTTFGDDSDENIAGRGGQINSQQRSRCCGAVEVVARAEEQAWKQVCGGLSCLYMMPRHHHRLLDNGAGHYAAYQLGWPVLNYSLLVYCCTAPLLHSGVGDAGVDPRSA